MFVLWTFWCRIW